MDQVWQTINSLLNPKPESKPVVAVSREIPASNVTPHKNHSSKSLPDSSKISVTDETPLILPSYEEQTTNLSMVTGQVGNFQGGWDARSQMRALVVGCNYPTLPPAQRLQGAVSDAFNWAHMLQDHFGFQKENIGLLVDMDAQGNVVSNIADSYPSRDNILENLAWLVEDAQPGDVRVFVYAGLGTQVPDDDGDEEDALDEALCPTDFEEGDAQRGLSRRVITDDELHMKFMTLPSGVNLTIIIDCAHSAGMLDVAQCLDSTVDFDVENRNNRPVWQTQKNADFRFNSKAWTDNPEYAQCRPRRAARVPDRNCWRSTFEGLRKLIRPRKDLESGLVGFCFAACRSDQTAVEFKAGEFTGLLSHCLLLALEQSHFRITYHDLFVRATQILEDMKSKCLPSIDQKLQLCYSARADPLARQFCAGIPPSEIRQLQMRADKRSRSIFGRGSCMGF